MSNTNQNTTIEFKGTIKGSPLVIQSWDLKLALEEFVSKYCGMVESHIEITPEPVSPMEQLRKFEAERG